MDEVLAAMQEHRVQAVLEPPTRTLAAELLRGGEACRFLLVYATFFQGWRVSVIQSDICHRDHQFYIFQ